MDRWSWEAFGCGIVVGMVICLFVVCTVHIPGVTE